MADIVQNQLSLVELAKRSLHADSLLPIAELLHRKNRWMEDAVWVEANKTTSHLFSERTSEPTGTPRELNKGIPIEASGTAQREEPIMMLEAESVIDERLIQLSRNPAKFRSDEDAAFLSGMGKTIAQTLVYGNRATDPRIITGIAPRLNALAMPNVHAGGGSADRSSLYLVQWGEDKVHLIYPQGSQTMGIRSEDMGRQRILDASGNSYWAWVTRFYFDIGLVIRNPRAIARVANIDVKNATLPAVDDFLIDAIHEMEGDGEGLVIYCNRDMMKVFDKKAKDKSNVNYTIDTPFGRPQTYFRTAPIKLMETVVSNEAAVS